MNTEKLIEKALTNLVGDFNDSGRAQAFALIAIAQELKRANDMKQEEMEDAAVVGQRQLMIELYGEADPQ
jgi:hypothetical protein